jgi:hypothetical protein
MSRDMRSVLVRCLVVLLAFALIGGNAHARLYLTQAQQPVASAQHQHQQHHHQDGAGQTSQHKPAQDKGLRCCCDAFGCFSVYTVAPELGRVVPVVFGTTVRFAVNGLVLHGRVLLPEPKPPRTIALT